MLRRQASKVTLYIMSQSVYINNISAFLPNQPVSNDEMESILGFAGGKPSRARRLVLRNNGIKQRYYAIDSETGKSTHNSAQLAAEAVRKLETDEFQLDKITCLVAASSNPDQIVPNHAVMVHGELDINDIEVVATSGICLCGITALKYGYMSVLAGEHTNVVTAASELSSGIMHAKNFSSELENADQELERRPELAFEKDFLRWMLSDAGGAIWLSDKPREQGLSFKIDWIDIKSYAHEIDTCMYAGSEKIEGKLRGWTEFNGKEREQQSVLALKQDVKLLNKNIVPYLVEKALPGIIEKRQLKADDIDYFVPHYSSQYFRDKLALGLENIGFHIPQEKWFTNLSTKGNTGSAAIYVMLEELFHSQQLKKGEKILCFIPESGRFSVAYMLLTVC